MAALVASVGGLEANSTYAYLLLCSHFADTCVVARSGERMVGALLGYRKPNDRTRLFIWQVGTKAEMRGRGVAQAMLTELKERTATAGVTHFELTIAPSNRSSWALFEGWARRTDVVLERQTGFEASAFGNEVHEAELLVTIGPFERPSGTHEKNGSLQA